jgi:hypothetical protein
MFGDGSLSLREFAMNEPLPLAKIQDSVLEFLRNRDDAALFGAQAVNAYVDEPRMTQDVDILSTRATEVADELRAHLSKTFTIAVRVHVVAEGKGFRVLQLRNPKNRHLADIRQVGELPPTQLVAEIRVPTPEVLIAQKIVSATHRSAHPKGDTDRRDLKMLLLAYPHLKVEQGAVWERLQLEQADPQALEEWRKLVATKIDSSDDADDWDS